MGQKMASYRNKSGLEVTSLSNERGVTSLSNKGVGLGWRVLYQVKGGEVHVCACVCVCVCVCVCGGVITFL